MFHANAADSLQRQDSLRYIVLFAGFVSAQLASWRVRWAAALRVKPCA